MQNDQNRIEKIIERLPVEIVLLIAFNYQQHDTNSNGLQSAISLAGTSLFFYKKVQPKLLSLGAQKLVRHAIMGEEHEVKTMLLASPKFLMFGATVIDLAGRKIINATAYEAALGAMDMPMIMTIVPFFNKLEDGKHIRICQHHRQYPRGVSLGATYPFNRILKVISVSSESDLEDQLNLKENNSPINLELQVFRDYFKGKEITQGQHFDPNNLLNALQRYLAIEKWSTLAKDLFWRQVIGYLQRLLPAGDLQAFSQGFFSTFDTEAYPESSFRSFELSNGAESVLPLIEGQGLGYQYGLMRGRAYQSVPPATIPLVAIFSAFNVKVDYINDLGEYRKKCCVS